MSSSIAAAICLIALNGGPADHFAAFAENLSKEGRIVEIYASGPALKHFEDRGVQVKETFSLDQMSPEQEDALAAHIAKSCSEASVVMTDVGHPFDIKLQKALARASIPRLAYYDNPEPYVPGGYSLVAKEVIQNAQSVLFANYLLAQSPLFYEPGKEIDFGNRIKVGLGYYPIDRAEKIARQRESSSLFRQVFLKNNLLDEDLKVFVYFGGNNEEYFSKAFPAFLSLLEAGMQYADLSHLVFLIQQHPGAKENNLDAGMVRAWLSVHGEKENAPKLIVSDFRLDEAQIIAEAAFYYQTSMSLLFALAGIPTVQIGHNTFNDILVRNQICPSVTHVDQFLDVIHELVYQKQFAPQELVLNSLGIQSDWLQILETTLTDMAHSIPQYLYKIVSKEEWQQSQLRNSVVLSPKDQAFIHLAKEDQVASIVQKFWKNKEFFILKLSTNKLIGRLVYESNPGGTTLYYHLYDGRIPLEAVENVSKGV